MLSAHLYPVRIVHLCMWSGPGLCGLVSLDLRKQDLLYRGLGVLACSVLRIVGYGSFSLSC